MELISQAMRDAAKDAEVLLYSLGTDTFLEDLTRNADRHSTSMKGQELRQSLLRKLICGRKRARRPWRCSHDQMVVETRSKTLEPGWWTSGSWSQRQPKEILEGSERANDIVKLT